MTQPTQEQIEAAALAIRGLLPTSLKVASDQLAEVALTAAAQAGEATRLTHADKVLWNEAIEHCARVAEDYVKIAGAMQASVIDTVCRDIAAAIRKLKDVP